MDSCVVNLGATTRVYASPSLSLSVSAPLSPSLSLYLSPLLLDLCLPLTVQRALLRLTKLSQLPSSLRLPCGHAVCHSVDVCDLWINAQNIQQTVADDT